MYDELVEEENSGTYNLSDEDKGININVKVSQYNLTSEKIYIDNDLNDNSTDESTSGSTDSSIDDTTDSDDDIFAAGVKIEGTKKVGYTLKGKLLTKDKSVVTTDAAVTYEWYRSSSKDSEDGILVGNDKTYNLVRSDIGK